MTGFPFKKQQESQMTGFPFKNIIDRHYKQLNTFMGAACFRENSAFWDFFEHVDLNFGLTCNRLLTRKHNRLTPETAQNFFSAACLRENAGFWEFFEHIDLNFGLTCNRLVTI